MSDMRSFEAMLSGGHPNSLGNTVEVVGMVLADTARLDELYQCYFSSDEVVRLRVSSAIKRVCKQKPEWLVPYIDRLLDEISKIDQASTQWTLAQLFLLLQDKMTPEQKIKATAILRNNLLHYNDWIVQITTMETLTNWAKTNPKLKQWLMPHLQQIQTDTRKSVAGRAKKMLKSLTEEYTNNALL